MEGLEDFIKKISDGAKSFADLLDKGVLKDDLGKVGTMGGLIKVGLDLYEQVKDQLQTDEERAFYSFYKAFESAKESIPAEGRDKIPITDVIGKNTKQELFRTFTKLDGWNDYLPDHPTIIQFRTLICDILKSAQYNNLVREFIFRFNITLATKPLKKWYTLVERTTGLIRHLEYSRSLIHKTDADLSDADLNYANLSRADLSNVKINDKTNFEDANITSSSVTDIMARTIGKKSNAKSSSMATQPSVRKITKYTSDGKPINQ